MRNTAGLHPHYAYGADTQIIAVRKENQMTYEGDIGVLYRNDAIDPMNVSRDEYLTDGPANDWVAPTSFEEFVEETAAGVGDDEIGRWALSLTREGRVMVEGPQGAVVVIAL